MKQNMKQVIRKNRQILKTFNSYSTYTHEGAISRRLRQERGMDSIRRTEKKQTAALTTN